MLLPAEWQRRFSLLPCQPGMNWHSRISLNITSSSSRPLPSVLWPLLYLSDELSAPAHWFILVEINVTCAWLLCVIQSGQLSTFKTLLWWVFVELRDYIALSISVKLVHTYTQLMHLLSVSQISQSVGLSWAGCSKGNRGPKRYWLWGYHGNSLPRGVGCLLKRALGGSHIHRHACGCTPKF